MKRVIFSTIAALFLLGCATTTTDQLAIWQETATLLSYDAAAIRLLRHPEEKPRWEAGIVAIDNFLLSTNLSGLALGSLLTNQFPVTELQSGEAAIYINTGRILFASALRRVPVARQPEVVRVFSTGIKDGINMALTGNPPPSLAE